MALLKSCLCCSLLIGSFISGVYGVVVYVVAFAIELSWIVESEGALPAPAFALCVGYFLTFVASLVLILGLTMRRNAYLFGWVIMLSVFSFPEAGLVLFMSLHYWQLSNVHGQTELTYWVCRMVINAIAVICVHSQHSLWREEKMVLRRLQDLNVATRLANAVVPGQLGNNTAPVYQKKNGVDYQNAGFVNSTEYIDGTKVTESVNGSTHIPMVTQDDIQIMRGMRRSASSSSHQHFGTWGGRSRSRGISSTPYLDHIPQSRQQLSFGGSLPEGGLPVASTDGMSPYHLPLTPLNNLRLAFLGMNVKGGLGPGMSSSEFDASTFHGMFVTSSTSSAQGAALATFPRVRSQADVLPMGRVGEWQLTPNGLAPADVGDYWRYPLPSRPISIGYMDYMHPDAGRGAAAGGWTGGAWEGDGGGSLRERRVMVGKGRRRALSVGDLRFATNACHAHLQNAADFPASSDGSRTSLGAESDDFHKYKDVAL